MEDSGFEKGPVKMETVGIVNCLLDIANAALDLKQFM